MRQEDVVKNIIRLVCINDVATISTTGCWYTAGLHSPFRHSGYVTRYDKEISGKLIIEALKKRGLEVINYPDVEGSFTVLMPKSY